MLAGAFPMVYLIRKYFSKPIEAAGRKIGLDATGAAGMLAAAANILAMFRLVKDMRPRDKVLCIAFAVCAAFTFGDHLAFTTKLSTQPASARDARQAGRRSVRLRDRDLAVLPKANNWRKRT